MMRLWLLKAHQRSRMERSQKQVVTTTFPNTATSIKQIMFVFNHENYHLGLIY